MITYGESSGVNGLALIFQERKWSGFKNSLLNSPFCPQVLGSVYISVLPFAAWAAASVVGVKGPHSQTKLAAD